MDPTHKPRPSIACHPLSPRVSLVALTGIVLILALACGQPSEPASGPAVVDLTPPPPINTVAPAVSAEPVSTQAQPSEQAQPSSADSSPTSTPIQVVSAQPHRRPDRRCSRRDYERPVPAHGSLGSRPSRHPTGHCGSPTSPRVCPATFSRGPAVPVSFGTTMATWSLTGTLWRPPSA